MAVGLQRGAHSHCLNNLFPTLTRNINHQEQIVYIDRRLNNLFPTSTRNINNQEQMVYIDRRYSIGGKDLPNAVEQ